MLLLTVTFLLAAVPLLAQAAAPAREAEYRTFFGLDSRLVIWVVAELHLMYGAFVLGVPIFAVLVEYIGKRTRDRRYDRLAREFTKLLSAAFSTTAALGGLLAFALIGLYPTFMGRLTGVFHKSYYVYALLFFAEGFTLYLYYYSWDRLQGKWKGLHIFLGVLLNVWGTVLMLIANAWASFMMSPTGIEAETGAFVGTTWQAIRNPLWLPLAVHCFIANIAFGGLVAGAYAAVKFLGATTEAERAHYDWMGYIGNFVTVVALIPLPFAGYFLGREVYSASPVMGNNMMGGTFSWAFIVQAILIGVLFIGANYYLWIGMGRIRGAERYLPYTRYINVLLLLCFAVWLAPHNLPLSAREQAIIGEQYHPTLKFLGLMAAKNAVVNFIILLTFVSFLLYRRANKGQTRPFAEHGMGARVVLGVVGLLGLLFLWWYAGYLLTVSPAALDLTPDRRPYILFPAYVLILYMLAIVAAVLLTFRDRGKLAQGLLLTLAVLIDTVLFGVYGFVVMEKANPVLRNVSVSQFMILLTCIIVTAGIDVLLFRKAEEVGGIQWGKMPVRSQFTLILLCVTIVLLMALMGYIRSGLREAWHIYGVMPDTSPSAYTPTMAYMAMVTSSITLLFLGSMAFLFWLAGLTEEKEAPVPVLVADAPSSALAKPEGYETGG
jgi:hypothetical protein